MRWWVNCAVRDIVFTLHLPRRCRVKITRILVGPEASKDKLKGSLGELKQISGLSGVVMGYSAN